MGADGGTIPKRCELVRAKKKTEKVEKSVKNAARWKTCQASQHKLKKPVIACRYGRLYNKEAVIEAILNKTIGNVASTSHIKGAKDFKELKLAENKDYSDDGVKGDGYQDLNMAQFVCPVTSMPMNGNHPFVVNWKCGCVFSEKALNEVKSDSCHGCSGPMSTEDILHLYPDDELLEKYKEKHAAEKKAKKEKKTAAKETVEVKTEPADIPAIPTTAEELRQIAAAAIKQAKKAEKRKAEAPQGPPKAAKTIQDDPKRSNVFKKLFTSSAEAKAKPESHWVTHNPFFY